MDNDYFNFLFVCLDILINIFVTIKFRMFLYSKKIGGDETLERILQLNGVLINWNGWDGKIFWSLIFFNHCVLEKFLKIFSPVDHLMNRAFSHWWLYMKNCLQHFRIIELQIIAMWHSFVGNSLIVHDSFIRWEQGLILCYTYAILRFFKSIVGFSGLKQLHKILKLKKHRCR